MMETVLVYNQCVSLNRLEEITFTLENGSCVRVLGRASDDVRLPYTAKLLQFFQTCRVNVPSMVEIGDSWMGPQIILGFEEFNTVSTLQTGYLRLCGFPFIFHELSNVDEPFKDHNVSLRVDIEMLTNDVSNCSFRPDVMSHVFEKPIGCDREFPLIEVFKHDVCVTFKSAQTSNVNHEADVNGDELGQNWNRSGSNWKLTMSLFLILTPKSETVRHSRDFSNYQNAFKRMRADETFADFTIITETGTPIKCHRCILVASSPYFARILHDPETKEATTRTMELPRMSTEVVGAMLDYLYTSDIALLEGNPLVCVELLKAGHQYEIETLQKRTKKILLDKASNWYTPEAALQLLLIMKDMDMADLGLKAVKVCKKRFPEIQNLPLYDKVMKNHKVMQKLFEYVVLRV